MSSASAATQASRTTCATRFFDEKIEGTIHLAMGNGFPMIGGTNESAVHWDMVKDLRRGGELYVNGDLVQKDGAWQL